MAPGRRIHGGKSWGRGQAIISFALEIWDEFDSWCLTHGIRENPWTLPSYRFGALVVAYMKEDKTPESLEQIEDSLKNSDAIPHAFFDPNFRRIFKAMCKVLSKTRVTTISIDNVVYDSRLVPELPVEERKRIEARAKGKAYRVPEWWRGEQANYKIAKQMMVSLPKKMGPIKD